MRAALEYTPADGHPIVWKDGMWHVLSRDRGWTISKHTTLNSAKDWRKARFHRIIHLHAASAGELRTATFEGREHVVVPIVALKEGVIFASNADTPEFVSAAELEKTVNGWNGAPIVFNHPEGQGGKITANSPETLDRLCIGRVFNAKMDGKKLVMDAYLDPTKVKAVDGADAVLNKIRAGQVAEVSVGAFVQAEERSGEFQGKPFRAVWKQIVPDHLALLPEGVAGACSVQMGCGTRAASENEEMREAARRGSPYGKSGTSAYYRNYYRAHHGDGGGAGSVDSRGPGDMVQVTVKALSAQEGTMDVTRILALHAQAEELNGALYLLAKADEDTLAAFELAAADDVDNLLVELESRGCEAVSDMQVRKALEAELKPMPGFMGLDSVFDDGTAIYAVMTGEDIKLMRTPFEIDKDGKAVLPKGKKHEEVRPVTKFEPVGAAEHTVAGGCGCGGNSSHKPAEDVKMADQEKVKALAEGKKLPFSAEELGKMTDAQLDALQALTVEKKEEPKAAAAHQMTDEEFEACAPPSVKAIVASHKERIARRKDELLKALAASKQTAFGEEELKLKAVEELEKIAALAAPEKVVYAGQGLPRVAEGKEEEVPAPPSMKERILAARKSA